MRGLVRIELPNGMYETKNLLVNSAREVMRNLIAGANTSANVITYVGIGTGTSQPAVTDTALENEVARVQITTYQFPDFNVVDFEAYVDQNTANGYTLTEIGLFTAGDTSNPNGTLFARALIAPINKDSSLAFYVKWRIVFT
ncbi:MAG: hypothetical protein GXO39_04220 [Thermotogae bacterium]|nr:hypothetical protein [Thermotogota bacterium]